MMSACLRQLIGSDADGQCRIAVPLPRGRRCIEGLWARPENAHLAINGFIINISLPALTLQQIHGIQLHGELLYPVLMPWLMFGVGANTWFVGVPMIESFYVRTIWRLVC